MNYIAQKWKLWLMLFVFSGCAETSEYAQEDGMVESAESNTVRVAAASSTRFALDKIIDEFEKINGDLKIEPVYNASGKLTAQIEHGASYDIFLSADTGKCMYLKSKGIALYQYAVYAEGMLVLWTDDENINLAEHSLDSLWRSEQLKSIAIADPVTAPYGSLAKEYLIDRAAYEYVEDKLRVGSSIAQTTQYIESGSVDIGFTAKSVVMSNKLNDVGRWVELNGYTVKQGGVLLSDKMAGQMFFNFLLNDRIARGILKNHGYSSKKEN